MIIAMPRASAAAAYSAIRRGVRWAETTRHSCGTPNCSSTSAACRIVSQSDLLPMMTPTSGCSAVIGRSYCRQAPSRALAIPATVQMEDRAMWAAASGLPIGIAID